MTNGTQPSATGEFVISRVFEAPRQRVWEAWTDPAGIAAWFGPKGATCRVASFELRPGGVLHSSLRSPDGGETWAKFVYRTVEPPSRLVWEHSFADAHGNVARAPFSASWPLRLLTTVTFDEQGGKTKVTLVWAPLEATDEERRTFEAAIPSMQGGWGGSFDQLAAHLQAG